MLKFKTQSGNSSQWIFNSKASSHTQKQERGLIFSTNHTGYFHSHMPSMNCWPKENKHFRYLRVRWHYLTSLQFPSPLGLKRQDMLQWVLLSAELAYARGQFVQWRVTPLNNADRVVQKFPFSKSRYPQLLKDVGELRWGSRANRQWRYLSLFQLKTEGGRGNLSVRPPLMQ